MRSLALKKQQLRAVCLQGMGVLCPQLFTTEHERLEPRSPLLLQPLQLKQDILGIRLYIRHHRIRTLLQHQEHHPKLHAKPSSTTSLARMALAHSQDRA